MATDSPPTVETKQPKLRWYQYSLRSLLVVVTLGLLATSLAKWYFSEPPPVYRTLPEILALYQQFGRFDLVRSPDRPGPYMLLGACCTAGEGQPVSGSFFANGKTRKFHIPGVGGQEFRVVGLVPLDGGEPTYAVLKVADPYDPKNN
jgi:hypothetical protein